jgi:hypothetical protein
MFFQTIKKLLMSHPKTKKIKNKKILLIKISLKLKKEIEKKNLGSATLFGQMGVN